MTLPKPPAISYEERVKAAVDAMALKIASDPSEHPDHRRAARESLLVPSSQEIGEILGTLDMRALKRLRSALQDGPCECGCPVVRTKDTNGLSMDKPIDSAVLDVADAEDGGTAEDGREAGPAVPAREVKIPSMGLKAKFDRRW